VKYAFIVTNIYFAEEEYDAGRVLSLSGYLSDEFDSLIDSLIDDRGDDLAEKMRARCLLTIRKLLMMRNLATMHLTM
jgi:hypothetical protein